MKNIIFGNIATITAEIKKFQTVAAAKNILQSHHTSAPVANTTEKYNPSLM
jgi:hypothetical protein